MTEFNIIDFMDRQTGSIEKEEVKPGNLIAFYQLCEKIKNRMDQMEGNELVKEQALDRQENALLGKADQVTYYKNKINQMLEEVQLLGSWYPSWYSSLPEAIFAESYGFSGITNWMEGVGELGSSTACKIIGENIFYDMDGILILQQQRMSADRREKLRATLLLSDPTKVRSKAYHELYSADGKRITIYTDDGMTKKGQDTLVFRRYLDDVSSFEEQSAKHTIPEEAIPLFKAMVRCGFNVIFTGPPKSAKSTLMTVCQSCEAPNLEGLSIETDPEIPMHIIMPKSPIMQLVPNEEYMDEVISTAKRSDAQYVLLGEARTGKMLNILLEAANMGTRHSKGSMHNSETIDIAYDIAEKVTRECGGDLGCTMIKAAKSFHYVFNMISLPQDRKQKRLKGLWEMRYDSDIMKISMHQICKYRILTDDWVWAYDIGEDKKEIGMEENWEAFKEFDGKLLELSEKYPNQEKHVFEPPYLNMWRR